MIIGSYRSEEVDENSLLHNKMVTLREKTGKHQFQMSEIMIQPFRATEIEQLITEVVPSLRADHMVGLAELCHKRTLGNPFFTIEFLKMIHLEGSTFSEATIDLVWSVYGRRLVDKKTKPLSSLLPLLVNDHVFEECESRRYRWTHDKLQEAALALSDKRRDTFQLDIGKTLYYGLTKEEVEEDLFAIVDLINNGNNLKRPEFAVVNLRAAEKARSISAFQSAADYAEEGILLLQETDWSDNKSTALRLYSIGVESQLILGNVDTADRYQKVVLPRSDLSTLEMLPFQIGRAKALGDVELKSKEALEYCLGLLNKLGCRLVWFRRLALPQAISKFIRIANQAYAMPQSFYDNLEASNDTKQKYIGYLLSKAAYNAYTAGDTAIYLLSTVKLVELTLEVGAQEFSASAFTFLAVFSIVVLKDYEKMERFQTIALGMLKKFRGMHVAESIFVGYQLGMFWVKPLEAGRVMAEEAILAGKREGDLVFTLWSMALHVMTLPYTTGRPLSTILEGCPTLLAEFEETKTTAHIVGTKNLYQMFVNLNDPSCKNPSVLSGDIYSYTDKDHKGNLVHLADKIVTEGELVFWNEDYEISAMRALKVGESHAKLAPANFLNQIESFHRAVALYAAAIRTKKRMYKSAANKIRKRIADLAQYGNTTLQYYNLLLTAEHLSLKRKPREAQQKYETAILVVSNLGHLHHLGLLNERYSDFLLRDLSLEKESRYRLEEAIRYYTEWGAVHKVKALESRL